MKPQLIPSLHPQDSDFVNTKSQQKKGSTRLNLYWKLLNQMGKYTFNMVHIMTWQTGSQGYSFCPQTSVLYNQHQISRVWRMTFTMNQYLSYNFKLFYCLLSAHSCLWTRFLKFSSHSSQWLKKTFLPLTLVRKLSVVLMIWKCSNTFPQWFSPIFQEFNQHTDLQWCTVPPHLCCSQYYCSFLFQPLQQWEVSQRMLGIFAPVSRLRTRYTPHPLLKRHTHKDTTRCNCLWLPRHYSARHFFWWSVRVTAVFCGLNMNYSANMCLQTLPLFCLSTHTKHTHHGYSQDWKSVTHFLLFRLWASAGSIWNTVADTT